MRCAQKTSDRGAGFGIGRLVGQIVRLGETFVGFFRSETRRHIHLRCGDVAPQNLAGALQTVVAELAGKIGHCGGHIHGAHRMPHDPGLFANGDVRLVVLIGSRPVVRRIVAARQRLLSEIVRLAASLVDEVSREIDAAAVAGQPVKLDEGELDLLMPWITALLSRTVAERRGDVIDIALHDVVHSAASSRAKVGDGAFEQAPGVVELVVSRRFVQRFSGSRSLYQQLR